MADYYTNFSLVIKLTPDQKAYALKLAQEASESRFEDPIPKNFPEDIQDAVESWDFECEDDDNGIWIHSQYGGIDSACAFIQHLLKKFDIKGRVWFEWSHDCSKPLTDAYGGGAAIISATETKTMSTNNWIFENTTEEKRSATE